MNKRLQILGFIPARIGSKGIPRKNIYPLNGKPLIAYSIQEALKSRINRLIVSTDSMDIASISKEYGADVPFLRPEHLASDDSIIEDSIAYTLERLKKEEVYSPDLIVLLHPTTPLRVARHIDDSIDLLIESKADSVISVSQPMEHPCEMVYWDSNGDMRFLLEAMIQPGKTQRQGYPDCFFMNGVVYAFTYLSFMETRSRFGKKVIPYLMKQIDSIDIDTMDDLMIAEAILTRKKSIKNNIVIHMIH